MDYDEYYDEFDSVAFIAQEEAYSVAGDLSFCCDHVNTRENPTMIYVEFDFRVNDVYYFGEVRFSTVTRRKWLKIYDENMFMLDYPWCNLKEYSEEVFAVIFAYFDDGSIKDVDAY